MGFVVRFRIQAAYFVKVSMDGTPYLRKVDVAAYGDYLELVEALNDMFYCSTIGELLVSPRCICKSNLPNIDQ
jgi:hypothetical protein